MSGRTLFHETFDAIRAPAGVVEAVLEKSGRRRPAAPRRLAAVLAAAALLALMAVGVCAGMQIQTKNELVEQANVELETLRQMGLFHVPCTVTMADRAPEEPEGYADIVSYYAKGDPYIYTLQLNTATGKIHFLSFIATDTEGVEPLYTVSAAFGRETGDGEREIYEKETGIYGNFEAIMDPGLTIGEYCDIWAAYQGYDRWELPAGVEPETRYLDADTLEQWYGGIVDGYMEHLGLTIRFYRDGQQEPECAYISYAATGMGAAVAFGNDYIG